MDFGSTHVLCCDPSETVRICERELHEPLKIPSILEESSPKPKNKYPTRAGKGCLPNFGAMTVDFGARRSGSVGYARSQLLDMLKYRTGTPPYERNNHEYHVMVSNLEVITTALKANPSAFQSLSLKLKEKEWQKFTDSPTEEELVYLVTNRIKLNASQFEEFLAMVNDIEGLDLLAKRLTAGKQKDPTAEYSPDGIDVRPADPNVVALRLNWLETDPNIHSGDPVRCTNTKCGVILSCTSKLVQEEEQQIWECEFCGTRSPVDAVPEEIPSYHDISFILSNPIMLKGKAGSKMTRDAMLVFCVDTSGSMCVTTKIKGIVRLQSVVGLEKICENEGIERDTQYLPGEMKDETYVSRMETVQDALVTQIKKIVNSTPSVRVALVTFSNKVHVHGDCTSSDVVLTGERLKSMDELMKKADGLPMPGTIRKCRNSLEQKIQKLQENGQTALGPALLVSIVLAGKIPGSKVILCTDGKANIGVGNLDCKKDDGEALEASKKFYKKLGAIALAKRVNVSVITFKDTECGLNSLLHVVNATRGDVVKVDPKDISGKYSSILASPAIAIDVTCKLSLHKELHFFNTTQEGSILDIPLGSVKKDTELSYEFEVKDYNSLRKKLQVEALQVPFQLQVNHVLPDGSHMLRIVTNMLPITRDRKIAENGINIGVVGYHTIRSAASLAANEKFQEARIKVLMGERMMKRASKKEEQKKTFITIMGELVPLDDILQETTKKICSGENRSSQLDDITAIRISALRMCTVMHNVPNAVPSPTKPRYFATVLPRIDDDDNSEVSMTKTLPLLPPPPLPPIHQVSATNNLPLPPPPPLPDKHEVSAMNNLPLSPSPPLPDKHQEEAMPNCTLHTSNTIQSCEGKPKVKEGKNKEEGGKEEEEEEEKKGKKEEEENEEEKEGEEWEKKAKELKLEKEGEGEEEEEAGKREEEEQDKEELKSIEMREDGKSEVVDDRMTNTEESSSAELGKQDAKTDDVESTDASVTKINEVETKLTALDADEVLQAIEGAEEKWYTLGIRLGLTTVVIDTIDNKYGSDCGKLQRVVRVWLENGTNCSWQVMYSALNHRIVHELNIAEKVKEKYMNNET